jgi:hypothetical protein
MFPSDVLRLSEFRTMRNHLSETLMLNDIQITSDYMSNTFNAVHHLAVTVRSDIYMKCNIYSENNNDFQKAKSSLKPAW